MRPFVTSRFVTLLVALFAASSLQAEILFFDDFEDRVRDQPTLGNNWTWYDATFGGDTCTGETIGEFGPFSDGDGSDFEHENRNYWTASADQGQGDSYFRAGLEVPAWEGALSNMLRVYGNQYVTATSCHRTLIFQQLDIAEAGPYTFSFDVAQDQFGAPVNGEIIAAFVKVLRQSDGSFAELIVESLEVSPPVASSPLDVATVTVKIEFSVPEEMVGELLQFGFYNDVTTGAGQAWDTSGAYYDNVTLATTDIGPGHSGSFFNADQSGHGFSIEFGVDAQGAPLGVVYWYTYDDQGNNVFLIGAGVPEGRFFAVDFGSAQGMVYGDFDPTTVTRDVAGMAVFEFTSRDSAIFNYMPSAFAEETFGHTTPVEDLVLEKLFAIPADDNFPAQEQ